MVSKVFIYQEGNLKKIKILVKEISYISVALGLYYLMVFSYKAGIPFPLDMAVLPTLLLALGAISILFTFVMVFYSYISIIALFDPLSIGYRNIVYAKPFSRSGNLTSSLINYFIFFAFSPVLLFLLILFGYPYPGYLALVFTLLMPVLFSLYAISGDKSVFSVSFKSISSDVVVIYLKTVLSFFYISVFAIISFYVFQKYVDFGIGIDTNLEYLAVLVVFLFLSFFIILPPLRRDSYQQLSEKYHDRDFSQKLTDYPAFFVYMLAGLFSVVPSVSYKTAEAAFNVLNLGGGVERAYYFSKKARVSVPPSIVESCEENYCQTKKVKVVFDIGGALYVKNYTDKNESDVLIGLPKDKLYMISKVKSVVVQ